MEEIKNVILETSQQIQQDLGHFERRRISARYAEDNKMQVLIPKYNNDMFIGYDDTSITNFQIPLSDRMPVRVDLVISLSEIQRGLAQLQAAIPLFQNLEDHIPQLLQIVRGPFDNVIGRTILMSADVNEDGTFEFPHPIINQRLFHEFMGKFEFIFNNDQQPEPAMMDQQIGRNFLRGNPMLMVGDYNMYYDNVIGGNQPNLERMRERILEITIAEIRNIIALQ